MNRIKQLRKEKGMSQLDLAMLMGVTQETISGYEREKHPMGIEQLLFLCDYFNCSTDYMLCISDIKQGYMELTRKEQAMLMRFRTLNGAKQDRLIAYADGLQEI